MTQEDYEKLKLGDKVRQTRGCGNTKAGIVYKIMEVYNGYLWISSDTTRSCCCYGNWELVKRSIDPRIGILTK